MKRDYFLTTERIGFSWWSDVDLPLAKELWGNPEVTRYICAAGCFTPQEILNRLCLEIQNGETHRVQYWPIFERVSGAFVGCCGLRPRDEGEYELGFHLKPEFWGRGYAREAAGAVIAHGFDALGAQGLFAGHNPANTASARVLARLGFVYTGDEFYPPTGLYHPSYELKPAQHA